MNDTDLLVEALARLRAIDWVLGDPGGPRHPKDYWDVERQVRWVEPLASDPPNWDLDETPLLDREEELDAKVDTRARVLRQRVRDEERAYQARVKARSGRETP